MIKTTQPALHGDQHLDTGSDPIPGLTSAPGGDTIDAIIAGLDPAGWWKLNETTGSVAADSSGNGLDLSTAGSELDPLWGAPAGPPGEPAADFEHGAGFPSSTASRVSRSWAALTGDFTAGIFASRNDTAHPSTVLGQGNPGRGGGTGWQLGFYGSGNFPTNKPYFLAAGVTQMFADNPLLADVWVMLAGVKSGTSFRFNVNGLDQAATATGSYSSALSPLWIGHDDSIASAGVVEAYFTGSYAFLIPTALTGAQLLEIYNTAVLPEGANAGKALLATGLGGTYWDWPIEVTY